MKNILNEGVNDFLPRHSMSSCKIRFKNSIKNFCYSRAAIKSKPSSTSAKFGKVGHSSWWD